MQVFELDGVNLKLVSETEAPVRLKCGTFGASSLTDRHLSSGNFEGQLQVWDLELPHKALTTTSAHKGLLNCIDGCGGQVSTQFSRPFNVRRLCLLNPRVPWFESLPGASKSSRGPDACRTL